MNNTLSPAVRTLLGFLVMGKEWLQKKRIPLWVVPLFLFLLVGACNISKGSAERHQAKVCTQFGERKARINGVKNFEIVKLNKSSERSEGEFKIVRGSVKFKNNDRSYEDLYYCAFQGSQVIDFALGE